MALTIQAANQETSRVMDSEDGNTVDTRAQSQPISPSSNCSRFGRRPTFRCPNLMQSIARKSRCSTFLTNVTVCWEPNQCLSFRSSGHNRSSITYRFDGGMPYNYQFASKTSDLVLKEGRRIHRSHELRPVPDRGRRRAGLDLFSSKPMSGPDTVSALLTPTSSISSFDTGYSAGKRRGPRPVTCLEPR